MSRVLVRLGQSGKDLDDINDEKKNGEMVFKVCSRQAKFEHRPAHTALTQLLLLSTGTAGAKRDTFY